MKRVAIVILVILCVLSLVVFSTIAFFVYKTIITDKLTIIKESDLVYYKANESSDYTQITLNQLELNSNVFIKTSNSGRAHVLLSDRSLVSIDSNTEIRIFSSSKSHNIQVIKGNIWSRSNGQLKIDSKDLKQLEIAKSNLDNKNWVSNNESLDNTFTENINKKDYVKIIEDEITNRRRLALTQQFDISSIISSFSDDLTLLSQYVCKRVQTEQIDINDYKDQLEMIGLKEEDFAQGEEAIGKLKLYCEDNILTLDEVNSLIE